MEGGVVSREEAEALFRRIGITFAVYGEGGDPEKPKGPLDSLDRGTLDLINLLVATGGVKGSIAVVVGALVGINALAQIHPDLASLSHGAMFAAPVAFLDALVMVPRWNLSDEALDEIAKRRDAGDKPGDALARYRGALAKYQREEALSNPCRSMPAWQDGLVACVARLTDEMLERAVVIGFLGAWIGDRAVEAGAEPYEVEGAAMYAAVACCLAFFEVRAQRRRARERNAMRAFRVQRDEITGKQKMVPMTEEEALRYVNESKYGLQGCVFTRDIDRAIGMADRMETGTVQINGPPARGPDHFPFQGVKDSGIGSQGIVNSIEMMTKVKTTVINLAKPSYATA